ncbi:phosphotransferase [Promicromonospora alba]|uniref:Phosphotransferase n=1 Tax=Promicromonospora alba TaxID=1616110 RepID=A0ABV9H990_9MICO
MTDEDRHDWLVRHLAQAAQRLGVTIEGEPVHGLYDRTLAARTSGPAWLRVTAQRPEWTKDEMWDGIATAVGEPFDDIPMPRYLRSVEWTDSDRVVRADLLTYVDGRAIGTGLVLDHHVDLSDSWWKALRAGLEPLQLMTTTERLTTSVRDRDFRDYLLALFGIEIDPDRIEMVVSHGDLHFGNLTGPDLVILDWENWGWAPAGYDAAHLLCSAILHPDIAERVRTEFAETLDTYTGAIAQLVAASKYLHHVTNGRFREAAVPIRRHVETVIREQLTS